MPAKRSPKIEDYATIEAHAGGAPVYAFGYAYILGVCPDLAPDAAWQDGNQNPAVKIRPKKSWEIRDNLCGSTPAREPKTAWNDDQPLLDIHLIDGDPETAWCSRGQTAPDVEPAWIRVDLPAEATVSSVVLVCSEVGPAKGKGLGNGLPGKALPRNLAVKLSRDAREWETVFESDDFCGNDSGPNVVNFEPRRAKQIWIIGRNLPQVQNWGHCFSVGEVEVRDPHGTNLAVVSRGAGVTVSSNHLGYGMDRFTQDTLWPIQYDLGFKWSRVGYDMGMFLWHYVERTRGRLRVDPRADEAITEARRCGVKVIMTLDKGNWLYACPPRTKDRTRELMESYYDMPPWPNTTSEMLKGYLRYADYMVRHFKDRVYYYEICNEWQGIGIEEYLKIAKAAIPVIRKAYPAARIMLGSTGGFDREAILACLKAGLGPQIDAIGWHPFYQADVNSPAFRSYRSNVERFKKECEALGFKGQYCATEWTWSAPYPPGSLTEMQKAKYCAQLMLAHVGMGVVSLFNETFQTGKIDWDCTLMRNTWASYPISPCQPQPVYYALRNISTIVEDVEPAEVEVSLSNTSRDVEIYTLARGDERLIALWLAGTAVDDASNDLPTDIVLPEAGRRFTRAWAIDTLNGAEQELQVTCRGGDAALAGVHIRDWPLVIRLGE